MRFPLSLPAGRSRNKPPVPPKSDYAEEHDCDSDGWGSDFGEDDQHAQVAGVTDEIDEPIDDGDYINPEGQTDFTLQPLPMMAAEAVAPPVPRDKKPGVNKLHIPSPQDTSKGDYYSPTRTSAEPYTLLPIPPLAPPVKQREDNPPPLPVTPRPVDRASGGSTISTSSTSSNEGPPVVLRRHLNKQNHPLSLHPWYHGNLDRYQAEIKVKNVGQDGAFLVRESTSGGTECQHKLTIYCNNFIRHLLIRLRNDGSYALGSYKDDELTFDSIASLVEYHKQHVITFAAGNQALLTRHVTKDI